MCIVFIGSIAPEGLIVIIIFFLVMFLCFTMRYPLCSYYGGKDIKENEILTTVFPNYCICNAYIYILMEYNSIAWQFIKGLAQFNWRRVSTFFTA